MGVRTLIADGPVTRLGQLVLAGEVDDAEPIMSSTLRVMDAYVLSMLIDGEGNYRTPPVATSGSGRARTRSCRRGSRTPTGRIRGSGGRSCSWSSPDRCSTRSS